jgi:hypothetical protein
MLCPFQHGTFQQSGSDGRNSKVRATDFKLPPLKYIEKRIGKAR